MGQTPTLHFPWPDPTAQIDIPEDIRRLAEAIALEVSGAFPGMIIPFRGTVVPTGWVLCDGTGGTPDLRDRFVLGTSAAHALGSRGGVDSQTVAAVPHTHTAGAVSATGTSHQHGGGPVGAGTTGVGDHTHTSGGSSGSAATGSGTIGAPRNLLGAAGSVATTPGTTGIGRTGADANVTGFANTNVVTHDHSSGGQSVDVSGANPAHVHPASNTSANGGVAAPAAVDNRPVFYSLVYIQKV